MADRFDPVADEGGGGGGFVMGLLTGTVLGAGLGMLFAPKAGNQLRSHLSEQAGNLANTASEGYRAATENAGGWAERGRDAAGELAEKTKDIYGKAREAVKTGADEAQRYVRDAASGVTGPPPAAAAGSAGSSGSTGSSGSGHSAGSSYGGGSESPRPSGPNSPRVAGSANPSSTRSHSGGDHSGAVNPVRPAARGGVSSEVTSDARVGICRAWCDKRRQTRVPLPQTCVAIEHVHAHAARNVG